MRYEFTIIAIATTFALNGCANMSETQKGTGVGAGLGAATGAGIGAIAGGGKGAAIGAVAGASVGAAGGYSYERQFTDMSITSVITS